MLEMFISEMVNNRLDTGENRNQWCETNLRNSENAEKKVKKTVGKAKKENDWYGGERTKEPIKELWTHFTEGN